MSLGLTPEMLEAAYESLRATRPFKRWGLPPADEVEFRIIDRPDRWGRCGTTKNGTPYIEICASHTTVAAMNATLAHEVIHLHLHRTDKRTHHGPRFKALAAEVCKHHGFDPKNF